MKQEYMDWVKENVPENPYGECAEITEKMSQAFPELRRVRGHYYCTTWGERAHWWLIDEDMQVVDPTASQFPSKGTGVYVAWTEGTKEPTGLCPNCGEHCYDGDQVCSESCHNAYVSYLMGAVL
jgi:hypothetical protein